MSEYSKKDIGKQAAELGFIRDAFEKMRRLVDILAFFEVDPLLSRYLALKGGTAINLTVLSLPRLSVDIDLDFAENLPLEEMMRIRESIRTSIRQFMSMNGYTRSEKSKEYHTLDSDVFQDIRMRLMPMLRKHERFDLAYAKERVRGFLSKVLVLTDADKEFLSSFADGEYRPGLLFSGDELARVANHPMAIWKMQNRR